MNLFLTGATGNLGGHLIPRLKEKYSLTALKHKKEPLEAQGIKWMCADLTQEEGLFNLLQGIDCVLHLAAVTHSNDAQRYFLVNEIGTLNLVRACEARNIKHFIFLSTRAIDPAGGAYSQSKLAAENILRNSMLNWTILRPSEVYGFNSNEIVAKLMRLIKNFNFIPIPGDGTAKIAPLFIEDLSRFILRIILDSNAFKKEYTLAGPREYTLAEFVDHVACYSGKQHKVIKINVPLGALRFLLEVNSRLKICNNFCKDQLPRLIIRKDFDSSQAAKDFDFHPIDIREGSVLITK